MKADHGFKRSGAALLVTLFLVAAITLIVVSYFAITRQEISVSGATVSETRAKLGEEAAFAEAGALLQSLTYNDHYFVTLASTETAGRPTRYTFISTAGTDGITHVPLFAGGETVQDASINLDTLSTDDLTDAPAARPEIRFRGETRDDLIELPKLTGLDADGKLQESGIHPQLGTIEMLPTEDLPYRTRYTYWIEDLEGYPNLDVVGAWSSDGTKTAIRHGYSAIDSRVGLGPLPLAGGNELAFTFPRSLRGQSLLDQVAPGLSPREILLQTWPLTGISADRHPFHNAARLSAERNWIADTRYPAVGHPDREPERFSSGLQPYRRVPLIPYSHGYPDEGKPRFNLNTLVANRDLTIADIVEKNLPDFRNRRGGFPDDEDYVGTLAANAIDYADADSLPSLPENVNNAGTRKFRGVDSYCPVNEFFVKFEYVGYEPAGEYDLVVFEATPYAEFWNTSDVEVLMTGVRLRFSFLERIKFTANSEKWDISDSHRVLDEPFSAAGGLSIYVAPGHYEVVNFGKIRWKVPVRKDPIVPFPIVQLIEAFSGGSYVSANYELFYGPYLIDQCGRRDPAEKSTGPKHGFYFTNHGSSLAPGEFFMRMTLPNLARRTALIQGGHYGDPWMPWYSRSTSDFNADVKNLKLDYERRASPGFRNVDHFYVTPSRKDRMRDQTRVRDWPDRGYDSPPHIATAPDSKEDLPDAFNTTDDPKLISFAPWRISNRGRFHSTSELGNLHDPVMWVPQPKPGIPFSPGSSTTHRYDSLRNGPLKSLPKFQSSLEEQKAIADSKAWGGGNTLRIGRPEHELFDQPGMRASQWLDLFHTGVTGTNLGIESGPVEDLYRHYDPRDHQPPPAAPDPVGSQTEPCSLVFDPDLHAQSIFQLIHGHLNLNTTPTRFEIETLLRGPSVSSDLRLKTDDFKTPVYEREGETGTLRSALKEETIPLIAQGLMDARPFISPSHLARVFSELIERHDALPDHHNDAEAEEPFARLFNTTSLSSRHFRIHAAAEVYHAETGEVVGRARGVREVFLRPVHDADGELRESRLEVISSRDL